MKCRLNVTALLAGIIILTAGAANAVNITIYDGQGSGSGWNGAQEDQEVTANCIANQSWDLEGFYLNGSTLSMVGGYDFMNGQSGFKSGDIFIDTNGDAQYGIANAGSGSGYGVVSNTFGYEYALVLDFKTNTYDVISLNNASAVTVYYGQNVGSNPWKYSAGGALVGDDYSFTYKPDLTDDQASAAFGTLTGGLHNVVSLDLSFLGTETFTTHFTMGCGNDNLMGSTAVPEPGTLLLLGAGLVGLAGFRRRKRN